MGWTATSGINVPSVRVVRTGNKGAARDEHYHDRPGHRQVRLPDPRFGRNRKDRDQAQAIKERTDPFFEKQELCTVVIEACGAAHHWARILTGLGHEVKLIAPEAVKPFVKKGKKNDAADAAALCAAASRPDMKFVPVKTIGAAGHPGVAFGSILAG